MVYGFWSLVQADSDGRFFPVIVVRKDETKFSGGLSRNSAKLLFVLSQIAGAGILGIIKKLGRIERKRSVVTVEGGLYEHYRIFRNYLNSSVWEMLGNDLSDNVVIEHSHGESGTGAVSLAASQTLTVNS
ncbi:Phosphotransferase [Quillaja saponaria]|uniref:Phosphotransferase n=1 Tax=Quillaja saponaria TaxID=32244 RepID=A0AAD7KRW1_QUISA|nr:Phosphotransferase [Quillaja saponaria]